MRVLSLLVLVFSAAPTGADCVSPAGQAGQFQTIGTNYQVCDGNAWSSMSAGSTGTSCSTVGLLTGPGVAPVYCNGTTQVSMNGSEVGDSCAGTTSGTMQYNATLGYMQWCNGTNWRAMRNSAHGFTYVQQAARYENANGITTFTSDPFDGTGNIGGGNTVICFILADTGPSGSIASVTATGSQAFTRAAGPTTVGGNASAHRGEIWYRTNMTASTGTRITVNMTVATTDRTMFCNEYTGVASAQALDGISALGSQPGPTMTSGSVSTTTAKELLFGAGCFDGGIVNQGTGYTARGTTYNDCRVQDRFVNVKGSYNTTFGSAGTSTWRGIIMFATFRGK